MDWMPPGKHNSLGLYISIPFCRSKCTYCNFASGVYPASEHRRYVDRLIEDLSGARARAERLNVELPEAVDTIYLGGGTPSLLPPELLADLFAAIRAEFHIQHGAEITMECAPGQIPDEFLAAMAANGINRVSLGVQSFVDREAAVSGRLHHRTTVFDDLRRLRSAGIVNLNVDLIAGLAGQSLASWNESLDALICTQVPHASVYMLEVDEDSRLGREVLGHGARYFAELVPTDEAIVEMYSTAIEKLSGAGLEQYEISNFCRSGFASRHNLRYWQRRPYLGVGLDASSLLRASSRAGQPRCMLRSATTSDMNAFLTSAAEHDITWEPLERQHEEAWFLGLRMNRGVELAEIENEFGKGLTAAALEVVHRFQDSGLVAVQDGIATLTAQGRLLANEVFEQFVGLPEPCTTQPA